MMLLHWVRNLILGSVVVVGAPVCYSQTTTLSARPAAVAPQKSQKEKDIRELMVVVDIVAGLNKGFNIGLEEQRKLNPKVFTDDVVARLKAKLNRDREMIETGASVEDTGLTQNPEPISIHEQITG